MPIYDDQFGRPIVDASGAIIECGEGTCPPCADDPCVDTCGFEWEFTDKGLVDGGQDGAERTYADPGTVTAPGWSIICDGLRWDFEDSYDVGVDTYPGPGCSNHNPYTQSGTATSLFTLASDGFITITWGGMGEQEDAFFELMAIHIDGSLISLAHAPGGDLGCASMAPVVSHPDGVVCVALAAGEHEIVARVTSVDELYHVEAYYQFSISCGATCDEEDDCGASFAVNPLGDCSFELIPDDETYCDSCFWTVDAVNGDGSVASALLEDGCSPTIDLEGCARGGSGNVGCNCGEVTATITRSCNSGKCTHTEIVTCGCDLTEEPSSPGVVELSIPSCEPVDGATCTKVCCGYGSLLFWPNEDLCGHELGLLYSPPWETGGGGPAPVPDGDSCCANPRPGCSWPITGWLTADGAYDSGGSGLKGVIVGEGECADEDNLCILAAVYRLDNLCCIGPVVCINVNLGCGDCCS
jgi:hypothetical protein